MVFPAHIREEASGQKIQTAVQHSRNTASYAGQCLLTMGLRQTGTLMGLLHDCGKFKEEFSRYIHGQGGGRGSVNHTFAGVRLVMERYHGPERDSLERMTAELVAYAVGAHHGLFDCVDADKKSLFDHRLKKEDIGYAESKENFLTQCTSETELDKLFGMAHTELLAVYQKIMELSEDAETSFLLGLLARLLLSAVIDADRRDTAQFMADLQFPKEPEDMHSFWMPYLIRMEKKLLELPADTLICRARREISDRCRSFAEREGGIYRLNVPTGGGKTLSSLRYALAHAQKWGKRRIIFTSPLLSILEQNAAVIREYLGDDSIVLEHHSNVLRTEDGWELDHRELAVEGWDAPVIITTMVQLLNTLFEGRTTSIRRFQGLCNSIIVIDEVQTVPPRMLTLFNLAMTFLAKICGATILLCSATQPCLERTAHPIKGDIPDVVPFNEALWEPFRRTMITDAGGKTLEEIADFAADQLEEVQSLLLVCNRKDEAAYLFERLRDQAEVSCHLSASMCIAHRRRVLEELDEALASGRKCLCVSTQVIEAGVDISFHRVVRLAAGMDSVIQAAGRCNRHAESLEPVPVYVVNCQGENLGRLREIQAAKDATLSLLDRFRRDPVPFGKNLSSEPAIRAYYRKLYQDMRIGYQDYYLEKRKTTMFDLLSNNEKYYNENAAYAGVYFLNQAFKLAGQEFQVFDSSTRDLVVSYGEGSDLIAELTGQARLDPAFLADWERRARPYTVAVYDWQLKKLGNAVTEYSGVAVLDPAFYDEDTGLSLRPGETDFLEV